MSDKDSPTQNVTVVIQDKGLKFGTIGLIIGFVGLFIFSFILSPIAIIMGIIGLFRFQILLGPLAIFFGIVGVITSPVLWGILGMSALITLPFLEAGLGAM
jgi:hypothetical protein